MKMFEGVDCTSTRSSRDLWAEICSCLPNPDQEDGASNAFSDSFVDSYPESEGQRGAAAFAVELPIKPWAPLQDSEMYLASLGKLNGFFLCVPPTLSFLRVCPSVCIPRRPGTPEPLPGTATQCTVPAKQSSW
uniref:Coiled-coil domain containing 32 n=1 Tax=Microcebus murinus TaxID=30608 RepID=A0A8C5XLT4_MICMU